MADSELLGNAHLGIGFDTKGLIPQVADLVRTSREAGTAAGKAWAGGWATGLANVAPTMQQLDASEAALKAGRATGEAWAKGFGERTQRLAASIFTEAQRTSLENTGQRSGREAGTAWTRAFEATARARVDFRGVVGDSRRAGQQGGELFSQDFNTSAKGVGAGLRSSLVAGAGSAGRDAGAAFSKTFNAGGQFGSAGASSSWLPALVAGVLGGEVAAMGRAAASLSTGGRQMTPSPLGMPGVGLPGWPPAWSPLAGPSRIPGMSWIPAAAAAEAAKEAGRTGTYSPANPARQIIMEPKTGGGLRQRVSDLVAPASEFGVDVPGSQGAAMRASMGWFDRQRAALSSRLSEFGAMKNVSVQLSKEFGSGWISSLQGADSAFLRMTGNIGSKLGVFGMAAGAVALVTKALYDQGSAWDNLGDAYTIATGNLDSSAWTDRMGDLSRNTSATAEELGAVAIELERVKNLQGQTLNALTTQIANFNEMHSGDPLNVRNFVQLTRQFNIAPDQMGAVLDQLNTAAVNARLPLNSIVETLLNAGPAAQGLGLDIQDLAGLLGVLAESGMSTETAVKAVKIAMTSLNDVTKLTKLNKDFGLDLSQSKPEERLGLIVERIRDLNNAGQTLQANQLAQFVFGKKNWQEIADLIRKNKLNADDLKNSTKQGTVAINDQKTATDDAAQAWDRAKNNFRDAIKPFSDAAFTGVGAILEGWAFWLDKIVDGFRWIKDNAPSWLGGGGGKPPVVPESAYGGVAPRVYSTPIAPTGVDADTFANSQMVPYWKQQGNKATTYTPAAGTPQEHGHGALDVWPSVAASVDPAAGNKIVQQALSDPNVYGVIWNNQIYGYGHGPQARDYGSTGDATDRHEDHVHIWYKPGNKDNISPGGGMRRWGGGRGPLAPAGAADDWLGGGGDFGGGGTGEWIGGYGDFSAGTYGGPSLPAPPNPNDAQYAPSTDGTYRAATGDELYSADRQAYQSQQQVTSASNRLTSLTEQQSDLIDKIAELKDDVEFARALGEDTTELEAQVSDANSQLSQVNRDLAQARVDLQDAQNQATKDTTDAKNLREKGVLEPKAKGSYSSDKNAEALGRGFVGGVFEALGMDGSVFSKAFTDWGFFKMFAGAASFGMELLNNYGPKPGTPLAGPLGAGVVNGALDAVIPGVTLPAPADGSPNAAMAPAMAASTPPVNGAAPVSSTGPSSSPGFMQIINAATPAAMFSAADAAQRQQAVMAPSFPGTTHVAI